MATTTERPPTGSQSARDRVSNIGAAGQSAPSSRARQEALIRQLKAEYGITVTEKMEGAIGKVFENMIGQEMAAETIVLALAQAKINHRQTLQAEQARLVMNIMAGPEQTKATIAGFATGVATIARLFGVNEFADIAQAKADEIMATIKVPLNTSGIEDGENDLTGTMERLLERMKQGKSARGAAAAGASLAEGAQVPSVHDRYPDGDAPRAAAAPAPGKIPVSWNNLQDAAKRMQLDDGKIASLKTSFDAVKGLSPTGSDTALDSTAEKLQLIQLASKYLTKPQQDALLNFVNNPAGPIETLASKGPRG